MHVQNIEHSINIIDANFNRTTVSPDAQQVIKQFLSQRSMFVLKEDI